MERFLPLVTSLMRRYRVTGADADDVNQTVWLRLVEHLDRIDDPRALPGWLSTVTRHECFRVRQARGRSVPADQTTAAFERPDQSPDLLEELLTAERRTALVAGERLDEALCGARRAAADDPVRLATAVAFVTLGAG